ncbi:MAG: hypothetical protein HXY53_04035 [Nitrospirae bacterium]|nr:hypothetical protein [Nitrospirota bacterium]
MQDRTTEIFLRVRENFADVREKVSLIKPYFELMCFTTAWALKLEEFKKILGFTPEFLYESKEQVYAISVLYRVDDDITTAVIAHEFAQIVAREQNISDHEHIDEICVQRGFGEQLLYSLENDLLTGMSDRDFVLREGLSARIENLKRILKK